MATQEYLLRYIESFSSYEELPSRLKLVINEEEWTKRCVEATWWCRDITFELSVFPGSYVRSLDAAVIV